MPLVVDGTPILERVTNLTIFLNSHQRFKVGIKNNRKFSVLGHTQTYSRMQTNSYPNSYKIILSYRL